MSRKKKAKRNQKHLNEGIVPIFHQQNPPPGKLSACGKIVSPNDKTASLSVDRSWVNCPDCLSRPDPTVVIR